MNPAASTSERGDGDLENVRDEATVVARVVSGAPVELASVRPDKVEPIVGETDGRTVGAKVGGRSQLTNPKGHS